MRSGGPFDDAKRNVGVSFFYVFKLNVAVLLNLFKR